MILFTTFEFIRKPWEGKELEVEKAAQQQANNLFESISSLHTTDAEGFMDPMKTKEDEASSQVSGGLERGRMLRKQSSFRQDKVQILKDAYENPMDAFFVESEDRDEFQGVDEIIIGVGSPTAQNLIKQANEAKYYDLEDGEGLKRMPSAVHKKSISGIQDICKSNLLML